MQISRSAFFAAILAMAASLLARAQSTFLTFRQAGLRFDSAQFVEVVSQDGTTTIGIKPAPVASTVRTVTTVAATLSEAGGWKFAATSPAWIAIYRNGLRMREGADYTLDGAGLIRFTPAQEALGETRIVTVDFQ